MSTRMFRVVFVLVVPTVLFAFDTVLAKVSNAPKIVLGPGERVPAEFDDVSAWQQYIHETLARNGKQLPPGYGNVAEAFKEVAQELRLSGNRRINWPVVLVQSLHETGFYQFGGRVKNPNLYNVGGVGITEDTATTTPQKFHNLKNGVRAMMEHMSVYATGETVPNPVATRTAENQSFIADKSNSYRGKFGDVTILDLGSMPPNTDEKWQHWATRFHTTVPELKAQYQEYRRKYGGGTVAYSGDPLYGGKLMDLWLAASSRVKVIHSENERMLGELAGARATPPPKPTTPPLTITPEQPTPSDDLSDLADARSIAPPRVRTSPRTGNTASDARSSRDPSEEPPREQPRTPNASRSRSDRKSEPPTEDKPTIAAGAYALHYAGGNQAPPDLWILSWKQIDPNQAEASIVARPNLAANQMALLQQLGLAHISGLKAIRKGDAYLITDSKLRRALNHAAVELSKMPSGSNWIPGLGSTSTTQVFLRIPRARSVVTPIDNGNVDVAIPIQLYQTIVTRTNGNPQSTTKVKDHTLKFLGVPLSSY